MPTSRFDHTLYIALAASLAVSLGACASSSHRREVTVDFLSVRGVEGNTTPALVGIEDNPADRIRVGVLEGSALQLSAQWRASVWLAAFQASLALDRPLSDWVIWVEAIRNGERFDGPSAGALLTAAMLAGMTGRAADPTFTMTGTINPDGTIGPVGGIPQKFRAAIAVGKTRLGYPLGQHRAEDLATRSEIDLSSLATPGISIIEITDIETAYEQLTGHALPRAKPVDAALMKIPSKIEESLKKQTELWLANIKSTYGDYLGLKLQSPSLAARWEKVDRLYAEAVAFQLRGEVPAAYALAYQMFIDADAAYLLGRIVQLLRDGRWEEARDFPQAILDTVDDRLSETTQRIKQELARSPNELMSLTAAYEALGSAVRHFFAGVEAKKANNLRISELTSGLRAGRLQPNAQLLAELETLLHAPLEEVAAANAHNLVAGQSLAFKPDLRPDAKELPGRLIERLGQLFKIAGNANMSYFEETTLSEIARFHGVPLDNVKAGFRDPIYRLLRDDLRSITETAFESLIGVGTTLEMVRLAGALSTYVDASFLIAKYLSLEAVTDVDGEIETLRRAPVLARMLELAETKCRMHAARAKALTGEIPAAAQQAYQVGRSWQDAPSPAARLQALQHYWRASMLSQMAVLLTR